MKTLPLIAPRGCSLDELGLDEQRARAAALRASVAAVDRRSGELVVRFAPAVDETLVAELVATEQGCCSFLAIDYDRGGRVLRFATDDRGDVLDAFERAFG